jgi:hypothetical protein
MIEITYFKSVGVAAQMPWLLISPLEMQQS